jgi:hypothetical protein
MYIYLLQCILLTSTCWCRLASDGLFASMVFYWPPPVSVDWPLIRYSVSASMDSTDLRLLV